MNLGRAYGPGKLEKVQRTPTSQALWVLTFTDGTGTRRRVALSSDRRIAEQKRMELLRDRDRQILGLNVGHDTPLCELVDAYLADLGTRTVPRHASNVRAGLDALLAAIPAQRLCDLKPVMLITHRAKRLAEGVSVRTANLDSDRLRACLAWCVRIDLIHANPIAKLPRLKETQATARYRRRALSEHEIRAFLQAARDDDRAITGNGSSIRALPRVPQYALWRALVETGARWGELTRVAWSDLDLDRRVVHLRPEHTKAGRSREIPIGRGLVEELKGLRAEHTRVLERPLRPNDRVFLSARGGVWRGPTNNVMRGFDRILEAAGIDRVDAQGRKLDIHALRHTLATRLARSGVPLVHAQQILGHSDPRLTSRVYQHLDVEDLRGAIDGLAKPNTADSHVA